MMATFFNHYVCVLIAFNYPTTLTHYNHRVVTKPMAPQTFS